ncbi:uncharacterized protein LOC126682554 isoform X1 [Mercurialis annua]|uniref:uncharacterized protein LOC126682554 isoform X1 n=2 Tax=Mercurialis annua TaxID=3986 RepID=UPI00215E51BB|nr:uncharacterized protein LOC126682554 isoform X1 [Mercurialis annua]XP_055961948.1 uncharacterized protein LOC126682554 isoform X1 [Mercurialis annua]
MAPNKQWINLSKIDRLDKEYGDGIEPFISYAFRNKTDEHKVRCPCVRCNNTFSANRKMIRSHLIVYGIMESYTFWYHHGERVGESEIDKEESEDFENAEEIEEIIRDLSPTMNESEFGNHSSNCEVNEENPNSEALKFYRLLKDLDEEVYPGCKTSKLAAMIKLLHIKSLGHWTNRSFDMFVKWVVEILPTGSTLPKSFYEAKQIVKDLGLSYKKIDSCINNCMLYWKEEENSNLCKICGSSRWKENSYAFNISR